MKQLTDISVCHVDNLPFFSVPWRFAKISYSCCKFSIIAKFFKFNFLRQTHGPYHKCTRIAQ